jgi:8-amino-7-oxononanoate synthase
MNLNTVSKFTRAERHLPSNYGDIVAYDDSFGRLGSVENISRSGIGFFSDSDKLKFTTGRKINSLYLSIKDRKIFCGAALVARVTNLLKSNIETREFVGLSFADDQVKVIDLISDSIRSYPYVDNELERKAIDGLSSEIDSNNFTPFAFYRYDSPDLFAKCHTFNSYINDLKIKGLYQRLYRVTATSGLDNQVMAFDPIKRCERSFICYDSNSYLGLHRHPRVVERVVEVLKKVGFGTPSSQILFGTNRYLREMEVALSEFHGREETIVFPSGFSANIGTIGALIRFNDAVIRDRFAHASIHEGCRVSQAKFKKIFEHNDLASVEKLLKKADIEGCSGKLIVTDGVFSMHGRLVNLPELIKVARRNGAKLMIDDAHGTGVLGANGKGIEEHYHVEGSIDILMGTLSKSLGGIGGYVSGNSDLIMYLRYFAASGMFTTTIPAAICAGVTEALKVMQEEPEHRLQLWENIRFFVPSLQNNGFIVPEPVSPIVTVFVGTHPLMWEISRDLFDAGIKCGNVMFPAVPQDESILRLTINSRHTKDDLEKTIDILTKIGLKYGILNKTKQEIIEIGRTHCNTSK